MVPKPVLIQNHRYDPANVELQVGEIVEWTNKDGGQPPYGNIRQWIRIRQRRSI